MRLPLIYRVLCRLLLMAVLLLALLLYYFLIFDSAQPQFMMSIEKLLNNANPMDSMKPFHSNGNFYRRIAIVSILDCPAAAREYQFALSTTRCYTLRHTPRYSHFVLISPDHDVHHDNVGPNYGCAQKDFMFRRHCLLANWMQQEHQWIDWVLFIDADIAVVNPNHTIDEFIDEDVELLFIDRLINKEIMAGTYLAKNTQFVRDFLKDWANYCYKLPNSFHGSDNGAIHAVFMEKFANPINRSACQRRWEMAWNFHSLFRFEACVRFYIEKEMDRNRAFSEGRVKLLAKGRGWVRDGGHTGSRLSSRDFMFHGWKNSTFNWPGYDRWRNPFEPSFQFDNELICSNGIRWRYRKDFFKDEKVIDNILQGIIDYYQIEYKRFLRQLGLD